MMENFKISGVYMIKNNINKKVYIGSAIDVKQRVYRHIIQLKNNKHPNQYLQRSWNKYRDDAFSFEILERSHPDNIIEREQCFIDKYESYLRENGYNIATVAGSTKGVRHTEESKIKIGEKSKERNAVKNIYGMSVRGEESPRSILKSSDIVEIRILLSESNLTYQSIGELYRVNKSTIANVAQNRVWKHVKVPEQYKLSKKLIRLIEMYPNDNTRWKIGNAKDRRKKSKKEVMPDVI